MNKPANTQNVTHMPHPDGCTQHIEEGFTLDEWMRHQHTAWLLKRRMESVNTYRAYKGLK